MAITSIITARTAAVALTDTSAQFVANGPFTLYGDNFEVGEFAVLYRLGPSGVYKPFTHKDGVIMISAYPNTAKIDTSGSFQIVKTLTAVAASVGYEEQ